MILYYMPGACSLAVHIALRESGLPFELAEVGYESRQLLRGGDFRHISRKAYVPALGLDDQSLLTEVSVILHYIDALAPDADLLPAAGGTQRYRALEWLNFVATEIHKSFSPLFRPSTPQAFLKPGRDHLVRRLDILEQHLAGAPYLNGDRYCSVDAYLFTCCRWLDDQDLDITAWPMLARHFEAVGLRPAVQAALAAEGLEVAAECEPFDADQCRQSGSRRG
jgi:glutathione S-transferase